MSIPVELHTLAEAIARYGDAAFVLTGGDDGRPHVSHVRVETQETGLSVVAGRHTASNVARQPLLALLWPTPEPDGYSLIVDARAEVVRTGDEVRLRITPTRAVLHRPAPAPAADAACGHDCRPLEA
jgi:hypothetical protein